MPLFITSGFGWAMCCSVSSQPPEGAGRVWWQWGSGHGEVLVGSTGILASLPWGPCQKGSTLL